MYLKKLRTGAMLTVAVAFILLVLHAVVGKHELFFYLNNDYGTVPDLFFRYYTNAGDGAGWAVLLLLFIAAGKKKFIPLLVSACIISTLLVQVCKNFVWPNSPRPTAAIEAKAMIHTVQGVNVHSTHSFPSGHTTSAFCYFLVGTLFIERRWFVAAGFVAALLAGWSRLYLAQHFPVDVATGMLAAVIAVYLSVMVQQQWMQRRAAKQ
ncbi:MAG TPA: phosphatase PAP2 family protein [Ferruginibacter sp.]|nr:phosphatase PAP2 family protein [Ferruginibacter sp.]HMP21079.1 phosphatase PAP2 family protein [Ferruginibacter sp.]